MKCCTNTILDFDGSKTSDCDFLGYNIFNVQNQGGVSVWNISNHKHDIDTDIQIHIYLHSIKSRNGNNFWYSKCHKTLHLHTEQAPYTNPYI